ncbi:unnamed protein product [Ostreobium quekettii]|uniref:Vacuolar protein sorting-associated protein 29 n=1 Tax=Ostreobium quekettii TaxID=121088 RepID=A0A8S1IKY6_9CHLO|nr:unnamed protein product [Ostreobium quekettii]|eukprot:evm.model.scf_254EXC.4 EVM.evm.TU.scf_254EXC.4   scf_254EXC:13181-16237(+)
MVLVLCISDLHIPHRAADLPSKFRELLQPGKISHILCPGNLCCRETYDFLKTVSANLHLTKGDFDDVSAPEDKVLNIESFKIGICHGHQVVPSGDVEALAILQRRLDVDILVTGHTHKFLVHQYEDRLLMNPGSATGAYCMYENEVTPSFILMDITGTKVDLYIYQLIDGESKIKKMEFVKPVGKGAAKLATNVLEATKPVVTETKPITTEVPSLDKVADKAVSSGAAAPPAEPSPYADQASSEMPEASLDGDLQFATIPAAGADDEPAQIQTLGSSGAGGPVPGGEEGKKKEDGVKGGDGKPEH